MSRKKFSEKLKGQWTPMFHETLMSPAYRQLSFGARALFTALHRRCVKNNKHVYMSQRDAAEELNHKNRNDIANWYRELVHYGFLVQTEAASLGVDGKGKATHWRITDMATRNQHGGFDEATKDFLKWDGVVFEPHVAPSRRWNARKTAALKKQNPGLNVGTTVDSTSGPVVDSTFVPPTGPSGTNGESISTNLSSTDVQSISRLATRAEGGICLSTVTATDPDPPWHDAGGRAPSPQRQRCAARNGA
jgi:hypothetical protein